MDHALPAGVADRVEKCIYAWRGGSNIGGERLVMILSGKWDYGCPIPMNERADS